MKNETRVARAITAAPAIVMAQSNITKLKMRGPRSVSINVIRVLYSYIHFLYIYIKK